MGVITQDELAEIVDVTVDTLREWRRLKTGPDYIKIGKNIMYREKDVQDWLKHSVVLVVRGAP